MISRRGFLGITVGAAAASSLVGLKIMAAVEPFEPDHIILGCKDLDEGIAYMEKLSGYRAAMGGSHPGRGTRNALLKLGYKSYLEILAPDPEQKELVWHKELAMLDVPLIVGWAVAVKNIEQYAQHLRERGVACVGPTAGSRTILKARIGTSMSPRRLLKTEIPPSSTILRTNCPARLMSLLRTDLTTMKPVPAIFGTRRCAHT